ncbi:hypothetical protein GYB61_01425 [bacterium]|nr:hypothetical protein [bacterium]
MSSNNAHPSTSGHGETPETESTDANAPQAAAGVGTSVGRLANWMQRDTTPIGDLATLRRMDPADPVPAYPVLLRQLGDAGLDLPGDEGLRRWALIVHCLALARGRHQPKKSFGGAMYEIGMTDLRMNSLLRADFDQLTDLLPRIARRLDSQAAVADWAQAAWYVLGMGLRGGRSDSATKARSNIARGFVMAQHAKERAINGE